MINIDFNNTFDGFNKINMDFSKASNKEENFIEAPSENDIFMSFLTQDNANNLSIFSQSKIKNSYATDLVKVLYGKKEGFSLNKYIISKTLFYKLNYYSKYIMNTSEKVYNGIRPIIYTSKMDIFLKKYLIQIDDITYVGGSYPIRKVTKDEFKMINENGYFVQSYFHLLIDDEIKTKKIILYNDKKYIYLDKENTFVEIKLLTWHYDKDKNVLVCKDIIMGSYNNYSKYDNMCFIYKYMNLYMFKDIFKAKYISLTNDVNLLNENNPFSKTLCNYTLPFDNYIELKDDGNLYTHDEKEFNINIDTSFDVVNFSSISSLRSKIFCDNPIFNINITGVHTLEELCFDFTSLEKNAYIKSLNIDSKINCDTNHIFSVGRPIEKINIPCDFNIFTSLFLSGDKICNNLFLLSNVTINYDSEENLLAFLDDINKFIELFYNKYNKCIEKETMDINFTYKHKLYNYLYSGKQPNSYKCTFLNKKEYKNIPIRNKIGIRDLSFVGHKVDLEKFKGFFINDNYTKFEFIEKENNNENNLLNKKEVIKNMSLTKESSHILDLAREIVSIDYIGLDKQSVRDKVNNIIDEYNNNLSKKGIGLCLVTNESVYTNAILKLENLKDNLYLNFEKNIHYYDIIDLINILINKLMFEDIKYSLNIYQKRVDDNDFNKSLNIIEDLENFTIISIFLENDSYLNNMISYLNSEKQNIINYLSNNGDINYKNINEFIIFFRTYLAKVLIKVSNDVSKKDVISSIKKYTLNEINKNSFESENNYITHLLTEIDKVKKDILLFDSGYVFENLDYENLSSGIEIIDYLDKTYMKYYRVYLDLLDEKILNESFEKARVPKLY